MAQTFSPDNVLLSDSLGKEISTPKFTTEFIKALTKQSLVLQLGKRVEMGNQRIVETSVINDELTNAYFVDEGQKIGTAKVGSTKFTLKTKKLGVILPVTNEFLSYTWSQYFDEVIPLIVDKFNKKIDGAAILGLYDEPFESSVLSGALEAGNVIKGDINPQNLVDLELTPEHDTNAILGHRSAMRALRGLDLQPENLVASINGQKLFEAPQDPQAMGTIDGLPYFNLHLENGQRYPENTLIAGNFNSLRYGIPKGTGLRLKIADQATISGIQNQSPDSGDFQLFEQDSQALRAIFEIAVAVPNGEDFAVLTPDNNDNSFDDVDGE